MCTHMHNLSLHYGITYKYVQLYTTMNQKVTCNQCTCCQDLPMQFLFAPKSRLGTFTPTLPITPLAIHRAKLHVAGNLLRTNDTSLDIGWHGQKASNWSGPYKTKLIRHRNGAICFFNYCSDCIWHFEKFGFWPYLISWKQKHFGRIGYVCSPGGKSKSKQCWGSHSFPPTRINWMIFILWWETSEN